MMNFKYQLSRPDIKAGDTVTLQYFDLDGNSFQAPMQVIDIVPGESVSLGYRPANIVPGKTLLELHEMLNPVTVGTIIVTEVTEMETPDLTAPMNTVFFQKTNPMIAAFTAPIKFVRPGEDSSLIEIVREGHPPKKSSIKKSIASSDHEAKHSRSLVAKER